MRLLSIILLTLTLTGCGYGLVIQYWATQWAETRDHYETKIEEQYEIPR
jgi:hypothetical protein